MTEIRSDAAAMVLCELQGRDPAGILLDYRAGISANFNAMGPGLTTVFARASVAYFDQTGSVNFPQLSQVTSGQPRETHHVQGSGPQQQVYAGLLLERAATNVALWCRDLTNAAWVRTNMTAAHTATGVDNVTNAATLLTATAGNATILQSITLASSSRKMTAYITHTTGFGLIQMTTDGGATWTTVITAFLFGFRRCEIPIQTVTNPVIGFRIVTNGDAIVVDLVQNETGPLATSAIVTTTVAVTRPDEQLTLTGFPNPQELDIVLKYVEIGGGGLTTGVGLLTIGGTTNEALDLYIAAGGGPVSLLHRRGADVSSNTPAIPPVGALVTLRARLFADGSVQVGQAIDTADESMGVRSATSTFRATWSANTLCLNALGAGSGTGIILITSLQIYAAPTTVRFSTNKDFVTRSSDIVEPNYIQQPSALATSPWSTGGSQTAVNNFAVGTNGVTYSKLSNTTGTGGFTGQTLIQGKNGPRQLVFQIKHNGAAGVDCTLLFDATASAVRGGVGYTFNSDGTITFNFVGFGGAATSRAYPLAPGEYLVVVDTASDIVADNSNQLYASDQSGAIGTGGVASWLVGGFRMAEVVPVPMPYRGRLKSPGVLTLDTISAWAKGVAAFGIGSLQFNNADGGLDQYRAWSFDGYPITLYLGTVDKNGNLVRTLLFSGTQEQPDFELGVITTPVRTSMYNLDKPIVTQTLQGTGGVQGGADAVGKVQQRVYGWAMGITPDILDIPTLLYFVCDRPLSFLIYESGLVLTGVSSGSGYGQFTSIALMMAASWGALPSGGYMYATEGGKTYMRLQTTPQGQLIIYGLDQFISDPVNPSVMMTQLLTDAGVSPTTVLCDCYYPGSYPMTRPNVFLGDTVADTARTYSEQLARLMQSLGGWIWLNPVSNVWVYSQLPDTGGDATSQAVCVINPSDIKSLKKLGNPKSIGEGVPPFQVNVEFERKNTVQASGLAATVTPVQQAWFAQEFQHRQSVDTGVKQLYPLAQAVTITAPCLTDQLSAASTGGTSGGFLLADGLLTALKLRYDFWQLTVGLSPKLMAQYPTPVNTAYSWVPATMPSFYGAMLGVRHSRLGFTLSGKGVKCGVMNVSLDLVKREVVFVMYTRYVAG